LHHFTEGFYSSCPIAVFAGVASSLIKIQLADYVKVLMSGDFAELFRLQSEVFGIEYFIAAFLSLLGMILLPSYAYAYVRRYLEKSDDFSIRSLFNDTLSDFFRILGASIVIGLLLLVSYFIASFISVILMAITPFLGIIGGLATICIYFYQPLPFPLFIQSCL
jgi:hypothetical protein